MKYWPLNLNKLDWERRKPFSVGGGNSLWPVLQDFVQILFENDVFVSIPQSGINMINIEYAKKVRHL